MRKRNRKVRKFIYNRWKEWRATVLFIVFVLVPLKSSVADWNWVPTGSMNPTILEGDLVFVNKLAYDLRIPMTLYRLAEWSDPKRGDIVILFSPEDGTRLVKRVIGEPGDTILMRDNRVFSNGKALDYSRIEAECTKSFCGKDSHILATENLDGLSHLVMSTPGAKAVRSFGPVTVPQDCYFVMGDNRDNSKDSRFFGFVAREAVVGKAKGVIVSFDITDKYQPRLKRFLEPLR